MGHFADISPAEVIAEARRLREESKLIRDKSRHVREEMERDHERYRKILKELDITVPGLS